MVSIHLNIVNRFRCFPFANRFDFRRAGQGFDGFAWLQVGSGDPVLLVDRPDGVGRGDADWGRLAR